MICELKAWQWQVEGHVIVGIVHNPRLSNYQQGEAVEFLFDDVAHYPPSFDGEGAYFLGKLPREKNGDYVKCYIEEKGVGDPLKSLFGSKGPGRSGTK